MNTIDFARIDSGGVRAILNWTLTYRKRSQLSIDLEDQMVIANLQHEPCIVNVCSRIRLICASSSSSSSDFVRKKSDADYYLAVTQVRAAVKVYRLIESLLFFFFFDRSSDASHWTMPYKYLWGSLVPQRTQFFVDVATNSWNSSDQSWSSFWYQCESLHYFTSLSIVSDEDTVTRTWRKRLFSDLCTICVHIRGRLSAFVILRSL